MWIGMRRNTYPVHWHNRRCGVLEAPQGRAAHRPTAATQLYLPAIRLLLHAPAGTMAAPLATLLCDSAEHHPNASSGRGPDAELCAAAFAPRLTSCCIPLSAGAHDRGTFLTASANSIAVHGSRAHVVQQTCFAIGTCVASEGQRTPAACLRKSPPQLGRSCKTSGSRPGRDPEKHTGRVPSSRCAPSCQANGGCACGPRRFIQLSAPGPCGLTRWGLQTRARPCTSTGATEPQHGGVRKQGMPS